MKFLATAGYGCVVAVILAAGVVLLTDSATVTFEVATGISAVILAGIVLLIDKSTVRLLVTSGSLVVVFTSAVTGSGSYS